MGKSFERSFFCGFECYEIDWKRRHRRFHKDLTRKWAREEGEEEEEAEAEKRDEDDGNSFKSWKCIFGTPFDPFHPIYDVD